MDLDVIVKCRMSGDYSLGISAEGGASRKLKKAWRIYRCMPTLLNPHHCASRPLSTPNLTTHPAQHPLWCQSLH